MKSRKPNPALPIFIGYDESERKAYDVCRASILRHTSQASYVVRLSQPELRTIGLYTRTHHEDEHGQRVDDIDGKPFSTDFTFTRFLVPALSLYQGWALFCDCDFLFTADLAELFALADDRYAVMVVKHDHVPTERKKMGGLKQTRYFRKNWSSLILWNCGHSANRLVLPEMVNSFTGQELHAFRWLTDDLIGDLPKSWNHLVGVDYFDHEFNHGIPRGIHYTLGIPLLPGCDRGPLAALWLAEHNSCRLRGGDGMPSMYEHPSPLT